jgi:hypothetical protein
MKCYAQYKWISNNGQYSVIVMKGCYGCHTPLKNHDFSWFFIINTLLPNMLKKSSVYYQRNTHTASKQTFAWVTERWRMPYSHVSFLCSFHYSPIQSMSTSIKQGKDYRYQHFYEETDQRAKGEHRKAW